jgi:hypothetical protein
MRTRSPSFATIGAVPGSARVQREHVEVRHLVRVRPARAGRIFHSESMNA